MATRSEIRHRRSESLTVPMVEVPLLGGSMGLRQLVESIEHGTEPESSKRRNLGTVAIMEAAIRTAETVTPIAD